MLSVSIIIGVSLFLQQLAMVGIVIYGVYLISEGEVSSYLYTVLEGNVNVLVKEQTGKEVYIGVIGEGDIFGEAGILSPLPWISSR